MTRHGLTFRGEHAAIPAGMALCTRCGRLLTIEEWLTQDCEEGRDADHVRPDPAKEGT